MCRFAFVLVVVAACSVQIDDPAGTPDATTDDGTPDVDAGVTMPTPDAMEPPESIDGVPFFLLPFPCGQVWSGQTRVDHSPPPSVDFNRVDDDGDPVVAAASGVVARVENLGNTSYGKWIEIDHGNGYRSRYAHLSVQLVSVGQTVRRGQQIGNVGTTGGSTGPHLHYEQRHNGVTVRASFNGVQALYYGSKNYTSQNSCL
jgi:hypothetical protein